VYREPGIIFKNVFNGTGLNNYYNKDATAILTPAERLLSRLKQEGLL
jgi:hypothetical protein